MQDYINLINFLKENDESVRKDLEELRFGTKVKIHGGDCKVIEFTGSNLKIWNGKRYLNYKYPDHIWGNSQNKSNLEIIGNNLDYHHIMMYLFKKGYNCDFQNNNLIHIEKVGIDEINIETNKKILYGLITYNSLKPLHEQEPIVYKKLLDYFISIK